MGAWQIGLGGLAVVFYAGLSHWLTLHAAESPWAVVGLLGPLWGVSLTVALRQRQLVWVTSLALAAAGVAAVAWQGGPVALNRLYLMQHAGIHLALALSFGLSLRTGHEPTITRVARAVHGGLAPAMAAYCRRVTQAWVIYFGVMAALSLAMFLAAPWAWWSLLANLVTPVAIAALFVGEYLLRYWLHPEFQRASLMDAVRAYSARAKLAKPAGS